MRKDGNNMARKSDLTVNDLVGERIHTDLSLPGAPTQAELSTAYKAANARSRAKIAANKQAEIAADKQTAAPAAKTTKKDGTKVTAKTDAELGFVDDIPVVRADGSVERLGDVDPSTDTDTEPQAPAKSRSRKSAASGPKKATPAGKATAGAKNAGKTAAEKKAEEKQRRADERAKNRKDREDAAAQRKADREAAAKLKEEAAKLKEQAAAQAAADQKRAHDVVAGTTALAVLPQQEKKLFGFIEVKGVTLTSKGLTLPENLTPLAWASTIRGLQTAQNSTQLAFGDALIFGQEHYANIYDHAIDELGLARSTVKNYVYVARAFPIDEREEGLTYGHYFEAAPLANKDKAAARNILATASYEGKNTAWVREQVKAALGAGTSAATPAAKREAVDALQSATKEQLEADLAALPNQKAREKAIRQDLNTLVEACKTDEAVNSAAVLVSIARLQAENSKLKQEVAHWKAEFLALSARQENFDAAQQSVRSYADFVVEGEIAPHTNGTVDTDDEDIEFGEGEPTDAELNDLEAGLDTLVDGIDD